MNDIINMFNRFYVWIIGLLPGSPFRAFINAIGTIPYLKYLNWFFPVSECIVVLEAFLSVAAVYLIYQGILRYIHLIK